MDIAAERCASVGLRVRDTGIGNHLKISAANKAMMYDV